MREKKTATDKIALNKNININYGKMRKPANYNNRYYIYSRESVGTIK